jgi:hypothetical protein
MDLVCGEKNCRKKITPSDFDNYYQEWDKKIKQSIVKLFNVEQPLITFIDENTRKELDDLSRDPRNYKSVYALRFKKK